MKLEILSSERIEDFKSYCKKHKAEVDESFLYDEDLKDFQPNEENPTYIVTDNHGDIAAAASLLNDEYSKRGRKARFRIFHSETGDIGHMEMLMQAIIKHTSGLDKIYLFVPTENKKLIEFVEGLNFQVERYSFLLIREDAQVPEFSIPESYEIRSFRPGMDEETWCAVRNAGFAKLKGHEVPITAEMVSKMITDSDYIEGGLMILYHGEKPVGIIRGSADDYEGSPIMNIGPLAIVPEYQGKGLGKCLLRASLKFAGEKSYNRTILCVNGENERAKALYTSEGFRQVEAVICYEYKL